jgi:signal transduction histidine kinase
MCVPVLQAAFRYSLPATLSVVALADFLNFFWIFQYYRLHGGIVAPDEYVEAGAISFVYAVTGLVVWLLVSNLRRKELFLADSLEQLSRTRMHLFAEEKLAVVGRISTAIAGEIRNPISSITTSLAAARRQPLSPEQAALLDVVHTESSRLAQLTSEFVSFAQPLDLQRTHFNFANTLRSVAANSQQVAASRRLKLSLTAPADLPACLDETQIQIALTHLLAFAVDSSPSNHSIVLTANSRGRGGVQLQLEHTATPIPPADLPYLFDPFFRTDSLAGGLGLAITRNICRAHGGEVSLSQSPNSRLLFTIDLPALPDSPGASS